MNFGNFLSGEIVIAFEKLNWQHYQQDKLASRCAKRAMSDIELPSTTKINYYQEALQIEEGFIMAREMLKTNTPIHYSAMSQDYIGLCYTFAEAKAEVSKAALPHLFHQQLNITNGYDYDERTHQLLNQNTFYVSLQFSKAFLDNVHQREALPGWLMRLVDGDRKQLGTIDTPAALRQQAWKILQMPRQPQLSFSGVLSLQANALNWLANLIAVRQERPLLKQARRSMPLSAETILQACTIIENSFRQPVSTSHLAKQLGTNECYLKQAFRAQTGKSIHQYLTDYRLEQACQLLQRYPEQHINHIAGACGYQPSHFSQVFKKQLGVSPKTYRAQQKPLMT